MEFDSKDSLVEQIETEHEAFLEIAALIPVKQYGSERVKPHRLGRAFEFARPRRTPRKYHPKYVEAARELCARFLDGVNDQGLLPEGWTQGKYDVSRPQLLQGTTEVTKKIRLLDAA